MCEKSSKCTQEAIDLRTEDVPTDRHTHNFDQVVARICCVGLGYRMTRHELGGGWVDLFSIKDLQTNSGDKITMRHMCKEL